MSIRCVKYENQPNTFQHKARIPKGSTRTTEYDKRTDRKSRRNKFQSSRINPSATKEHKAIAFWILTHIKHFHPKLTKGMVLLPGSPVLGIL